MTPLTLNPISLSATYSGDSFFRSAASSTVTLNVQKAPTTLTLNSAPTTYTCGQPSSFSVTLSYPVALGLTNHQVSLSALANDGSVQSLNLVGPISFSGPLTIVPPGPKDTSAKATATISAIVPLDTVGVLASFGADPLLSDASSATVHPTLQPSTVEFNLIFKSAPGNSVVNPATFIARVTAASCSVPPTGTVEFLDGTASLAVVSLTADPNLLPFIEQASGLNLPSSSSASVTISRPPGVHNISFRYSGDKHYLPASSAPTAVTFQ